MISVLREVGINMRYGVIQKADFKIVYVAPMKALAAEVTANFSKRLEPLGKICVMVCWYAKDCAVLPRSMGLPLRHQMLSSSILE